MHESSCELAHQREAKRKQAPQSEANVCRRQMQARKNTQHKLGVAFSYLEHNYSKKLRDTGLFT